MDATHDLVRGQTLRWTFTDGPTEGTTYEHHFGEDGVVHFHTVKPEAEAKSDQQQGHESSLRPVASRSWASHIR